MNIETIDYQNDPARRATMLRELARLEEVFRDQGRRFAVFGVVNSLAGVEGPRAGDVLIGTDVDRGAAAPAIVLRRHGVLCSYSSDDLTPMNDLASAMLVDLERLVGERLAESAEARAPAAPPAAADAEGEASARQLETVELLEALLVDARAGKIAGVVVLAEDLDGDWTPASSRVPDRYKLVGLLEGWKKELLA